jgi:hypothetical protein
MPAQVRKNQQWCVGHLLNLLYANNLLSFVAEHFLGIASESYHLTISRLKSGGAQH